jgi:hypothetical protein
MAEEGGKAKQIKLTEEEKVSSSLFHIYNLLI